MQPDSPIRPIRVTRRQRLRSLGMVAAVVVVVVALVLVQHWATRPGATPRPLASQIPAVGPLGAAAASQVSASSGLTHPGILVTIEELERVRAHLRSGDQPWADAFVALQRSDYARLDWRPQPRATVACGLYSTPDEGCTDEWHDAVAAYTQALLWYLTGERDHADAAIGIIDAWSAVLREHTDDNAPLQAGWSAATMVRAAELIRYTVPSWPGEARAEAMFRDVFLPLVRNGADPTTDGNWDGIMLEAAAGIAIFLDDRATFDQVVARWQARLPAYVYLGSDGSQPVGPPGVSLTPAQLVDYWHGQSTFVDGLTQETCRDLGHAGWGLESLAQLAEIGADQGLDLWAQAQPRLVAAWELHAGLALGDGVPDWLCGGATQGSLGPIPELAYHHYHDLLGVPMPRTAELIEQGRPQPAQFFFGWETLTTA